MSSTDDDDTRHRSLKLCQLIYDRKIDSEIGFEIRKLLEEGVLIDFQDHNRNMKTAIHLAVEKCDVICVKFLLRFKPSLEVKDGDGKTPVELAELNGDQSILNALLNSTFDVVNETFVEVIDYQSITRQKIEAIKSRPAFKVLKLINCPSVNEVWRKLIDGDYTEALNESSHLFFIAIETNETKLETDDEVMKKVLNLRRPMIFQMTSLRSKNTKIYFKDEPKDFVKIADTPKMTREELDEAVQSEDGCNFNLLVEGLRSNHFGHFTEDLLATKLTTNEYRSEAINQFFKSNALCHRFFRLFDGSPPDIERILATLSFKGDQSLLALLDLPFELKDEQLKLNEYQQDILGVVDSSGCNLLMMAVEQRNLAAVKLLLRCGCDFNHADNYDRRASDICWDVKAFDCLSELIEAGSPYPSNFWIGELDESSEAHQRINAMMEAIHLFHEYIEDGQVEDVKKFITSHSNIKHAFDTNNKCALTVALESNEVDIYSLLLSKGFEPGADDEYCTVLDKFEKKNKIRTSHRKYFNEAFDEPHLKRLLKKSKLSFGSKDRAKCSAIIRKMFDELNEIDELISILQICSLSDKLRIVFDFNCDSVVDMDPTSGPNATAAVYPIGGFVYIGAKNHEKEFFKIIGALIHELTHYAMKLTYDNHCKPYDEDDVENENRFEAIETETHKICDKSTSTNSIVATVFSLYQEEVWHQELIVRVPHLLAHYKTNSKALEAAERNTPELFHFYRETTLNDVERQSKVLLQEYLIGKINNQTGIARKIENLNVEFENLAIDLKPSAYIITSNAPLLTLAILHQVDSEDSNIFVTLEQVAIGNILDKIAKVNAKESSTALIVDCIGLTQKYPESLQKLLTNMKNVKSIALVMSEAESLKAKENFHKVEFKTFTHKWAELTASSKVHLLNQSVIFQGVEVKLNELVEPSSEAMNFFPLGELVDCKDFKIGNELHSDLHKFYIPRRFIKKGQSNAKSFEELLGVDPSMSAMIISDEAGSGKSLALFEVARSLHVSSPDRWVLFVDLKRHIEAFKGVDDYSKIESFEDFIVQNILNNESKFDRELFVQMFQTGKTFVLFDGFDEICPNYKDLLLHVLKLFKLASGNQLFITTRPHLEADLEGVLGEFVFKLEKFSDESQSNFLREYWRSVGFELSQKDFEVLSQRLLAKFSKISASSNIVGLPLLMRMTAEIFDNPTKENFFRDVDSLSITSVFRQFVEKYFLRWANNENEIARSETVKFQMSGGVLEVHHRIALNHIFSDVFKIFDVGESEAEKISRVGLIRYDKTEKTFQFIHQTFAEYFVADFIWFHLNKKNRDPSHDCRKAVEVLVEVACDRDFGVIQSLLEQILEGTKFTPSEAFCTSVGRWLSDVLRSCNHFDFLRKSLAVSHENLTSLSLSIVKYVAKDVLLKMLQSKSSLVVSAFLDTAAYGSNAIFSALCDIIASTDNPKEIFQDEKGYWGNALLSAASNKNCGILTTLCAHLNFVFTKDEIKVMVRQQNLNGQKIISWAADEVFPELISLLPNYLSSNEIKSLLLAVNDDGQNFFHQAVRFNTSESLKLKFDVVKSHFSAEDQKAFFYQPATASNMFHFAARDTNEKIFETLIESTRDVLSVDDVKSMLREKDPEGSNLLHIVANRGNELKLTESNALLRERLSDDEIRSLLLEKNDEGQNCFRLAANSAELGLQVFCEIIGNLLPIEAQTRLLHESSHEIDIIRLACGSYTNEFVSVETIEELLTKQDRQGLDAFQKVARVGDIETWKKLISFAQVRFSVDEMESLLFTCDNAGRNCLHLAVAFNTHKNMIEAICETIGTIGLSVKEQKKFVRQKDFNKKNVFHLAAAKLDTLKCFSLLDGLSAIIAKVEIKVMLKEKDSDGNNILCVHKNAQIGNEAWRDLMPFLTAVLTYDEIKNLFFDVDGEGRNFFHRAVERSSRSEIKSLSEAIKTILSRNDQKKFFGIKSPNVFHLAANNRKSGIFSTLHECLRDVLEENEISCLIREKDSENENVLHLICHLGDDAFHHDASYVYDDVEKRLRDLLKVLQDVCDAEGIKNFLTSSDDNGSNCLLLAAQFRDHLFLNELFSFIRSELSVNEQRDLIQKCDNDGMNIFTCASLNEITEALSIVQQFAKEILIENQIEVMMMT